MGRSLDLPAGGCAVRRQSSRVRYLPWLLRGALIAVALGICAAGVWWLLTSPVFLVSQVESGVYRFTSETRLTEVFNGLLGRNIWRLSADQVRRELTVLPWVREINVHKRLPGVLTVEFSEWRPLLALATAAADRPGEQLVMVGDGRLLPFPEHLVQTGLPVLVGASLLPAGQDSPLPRLDPEVTEQVLRLMGAIEVSGLESIQPVDFLLLGDRGFTIVLQQQRGRLLVGSSDFAERLERYMTACQKLDPGLEVDLRFKDRITWKRSAR